MKIPFLNLYLYKYPRCVLTADIVLFNRKEEVLLIRRANNHFKGKLALPGGHVEENESTLEAVQRECVEETGLIVSSPRFVALYETPGRDPRGDYKSALFWAEHSDTSIMPYFHLNKNEVQEMKWLPWHHAVEMNLAADHACMIVDAYYDREKTLFYGDWK